MHAPHSVPAGHAAIKAGRCLAMVQGAESPTSDNRDQPRTSDVSDRTLCAGSSCPKPGLYRSRSLTLLAPFAPPDVIRAAHYLSAANSTTLRCRTEMILRVRCRHGLEQFCRGCAGIAPHVRSSFAGRHDAPRALDLKPGGCASARWSPDRFRREMLLQWLRNYRTLMAGLSR